MLTIVAGLPQMLELTFLEIFLCSASHFGAAALFRQNFKNIDKLGQEIKRDRINTKITRNRKDSCIESTKAISKKLVF